MERHGPPLLDDRSPKPPTGECDECPLRPRRGPHAGRDRREGLDEHPHVVVSFVAFVPLLGNRARPQPIAVQVPRPEPFHPLPSDLCMQAQAQVHRGERVDRCPVAALGRRAGARAAEACRLSWQAAGQGRA
eukprot:7283500-Alexandrium_andersonii.AAC.1